MKSITVVEAKANFSAILNSVSAGEEVAITRHGKVIARIVPEKLPSAADIFKPYWDNNDFDVATPPDSVAEPVAALD